MAPFGDAIGRVVARDDVLLVDLLSANQRRALIRFSNVPALISSACHRSTRCSTCFDRTPVARRCRNPSSSSWFAIKLRMLFRSCCVANEPSRLRWHRFLKSWLRSRMTRPALLGHGRFLSSVPFIELQRSSVLRGAKGLGKCSIPRAAARRESQGTRDTTPICASCFTARRRCSRYWRRAPCLWAQHTRGPLTQGPRGVSHTSG